VPEEYYERAGGLRFECTGCGDCCTRPGLVYFTRKELREAARAAGKTVQALRAAHDIHPFTSPSAAGPDAPTDRKSLFILDPGDAPCPFHAAEIGCTIYEARPTQCRTWPFWPEVVREKKSWDRGARECEGMNRGELHSTVEIEVQLQACVEAGLPESDPW
jgi:hypothetical protein